MILGIISLLAAIGTTAYSVYQNYQSNKDTHKESSRNQELADMAAADALKRGMQVAESKNIENSRLEGAQRAAYNASGIDASSGSALAILTGSKMLAERDNRMIQENANREAWALKNQKDQLAAQARLDQKKYEQAQIGTLLGGAADAAARGYQIWNGISSSQSPSSQSPSSQSPYKITRTSAGSKLEDI